MTSPTRRASELAQADAASAIAAQKAEYRSKLERLRDAFIPPLRNTELSAALGLSVPPSGAGMSDVARFLSESPRFRRARPDADARALIDALVDGRLYIAAQPADASGGRRPTLVCAPDDLQRLERGWQVVSLVDGTVPYGETGPAWEDGDAWDTFGGGAARATEEVPRRYVGDTEVGPIGLGAMRLSTTDMDDDDAHALVLRALERGVRLIDTADSYARGEDDIGRNERVIARALNDWGGDRDRVLVATKVGLTRPGGRWVPNGDPEYLRSAVEGCLRRSDRDVLDLVQLHVHDRRVPLADSIGALEQLRAEGKIRRLGVCNVDQAGLQTALEEATLDAVQVPASATSPGLLVDQEFMALTRLHGLAIIAHSPLGGHRSGGSAQRNPRLVGAAEDAGVSPTRLALSWLASLAPNVVAIPGTVRSEHLDANLAAAEPAPAGALAAINSMHSNAANVREQAHREAALVNEGVVLVLGSPASGKTSTVERFTRRGYVRFNRDLLGGTLAGLLPHMRAALDGGARRIVADNTYPTSATRREVVRLADEYGLPTVALHIQTSEPEAQVNACHRLVERVGHLPSPVELRGLSKDDPNLFPPAAIQRYHQIAEPPVRDDGLAAVVGVPFVRRHGGTASAVLFDFDGTLRVTRSGSPFPVTPDDVVLLPGRADKLQELVAQGVRLLGVSNQAGVARGQLDASEARAIFDRTLVLLGVEMDVRFCPHEPGAGCWCRKPLPGIGVAFIREYGLLPSACTMVGDLSSDAAFAAACGFGFVHADEYFTPPSA